MSTTELTKAIQAKDEQKARWVWWVKTPKRGWQETVWQGSTKEKAMECEKFVPGGSEDAQLPRELIKETTHSIIP